MSRVRRFVVASVVAGVALVAGAGPASASTWFVVSNNGSLPVSVEAGPIFNGFGFSISAGCAKVEAREIAPTASFIVCLPGGGTLVFGTNTP